MACLSCGSRAAASRAGELAHQASLTQLPVQVLHPIIIASPMSLQDHADVFDKQSTSSILDVCDSTAWPKCFTWIEMIPNEAHDTVQVCGADLWALM